MLDPAVIVLLMTIRNDVSADDELFVLEVLKELIQWSLTIICGDTVL
jgi:hypothetical protein